MYYQDWPRKKQKSEINRINYSSISPTSLPLNNLQGPDDFLGSFYQIFKDQVIPKLF